MEAQASVDHGRLWHLLDSMGERVRDRVPARASIALPGLGGVALFTAFAAYVDVDRIPMVIVSLLLIAVGVAVLLIPSPDELRSAAVGAAVVAIPVFAISATVGDDDAPGAATALLIGVLYLAAWLLPGFRGRTIMLGLASVALPIWLGIVISGDGDGESSLFLGPVSEGLGASGTVYLVCGALLLAGVWLLDRQGFHGAATGLVAAGLATTTIGVALVADQAGEVGGPALVSIVGVLVTVIGAHGDRRASTWFGAIITAIGVAAVIGIMIEPDTPAASGTTALLVAAVLIGGPMVFRVVRGRSNTGTNGSSPSGPVSPPTAMPSAWEPPVPQ
ncbi:MAG: hypothetical protein WEB78_06125 [Ilumatobacteraceae bacterium]